MPDTSLQQGGLEFNGIYFRLVQPVAVITFTAIFFYKWSLLLDSINIAGRNRIWRVVTRAWDFQIRPHARRDGDGAWAMRSVVFHAILYFIQPLSNTLDLKLWNCQLLSIHARINSFLKLDISNHHFSTVFPLQYYWTICQLTKVYHLQQI